MAFDFAVVTDRGRRSDNQDVHGSTVLASGLGCWALADGLGGHRGGGVAAALTVRAILAEFERSPAAEREAVEASLRAAHDLVLQDQESNPDRALAGATAAVLISDGRQACWGHVGDARLYAFRGGVLCERTRDDSVPQLLVDTKEIDDDEIRGHPMRNRVLRHIGSRNPLRPNVGGPSEVARGDAFLLCSDGFWESIVEAEMEAALRASSDAASWLQAMNACLAVAPESTSDNYTAVAVVVT